ncbi:aminotransferase class III-fold pyridoxal phosphate-dependent enzyme [Sulfitobacter sp. F26204]|uniref:aminotransferase class III-fold pyridoxal phosphate-dependent enzyme n=1 Tax=Sulfitobacter sp. F26204 TaxID=2996014 RepID=UPI00225DF948|nr:aminotransferase class III-fold pyridoxal phosphate-dependent enzyme [Sulfitobacter sp. F26204]MCX7561280.1 aminotransferase class III-fold pyridoxal phosphate-dependent enzyme [Sulfitobacter sp. F26204]
MAHHWQQVLQEEWGIEATLKPLDGEYDLNFLALGSRDYVLKVMRVGCDTDFIEMQCRALDHIARNAPEVCVPKVIKTLKGKLFITVPDEIGDARQVWLLEKLEGRTYADFKPQSPALLADVGRSVGAMDRALADYTHPALSRDFKWNLGQGGWICDQLDVIRDAGQRAMIADIAAQFAKIEPALNALPRVAIHNDVNDYNIIVAGLLTQTPHVTGLIDLGDMCASPRICDLAITCAYMVLGQENPEQVLAEVVAGYHESYPLTAAEVDLIWPLLRMRLAVSVVNSSLMALENPDDPYVVISQKPAWALLQNDRVNAGLINARLRAACGLPVTDAAPRILDWLKQQRGSFSHVFGMDLKDAPMVSLSVEKAVCPRNPFEISRAEAASLGQDMESGADVWLGYYNEPRLIYTAPAFRRGRWRASNRRTVHLAIDVFAAAQTELHAPLKGVVHMVENRTDHLDYGGVVILRHETPAGDAFFTLYGHLNPDVCEELHVGQTIEAGQVFARLGDVSQSGGWAPHVHLQLALSIEGMGQDWPGVADPDEMYLWRALCPNPAALLNLQDTGTGFAVSEKTAVLADRNRLFGQNLKLSYDDPVMLVRGWRHHMFDEWGRPYLDAYNNVPHVGHAHPRIQAVAADQLRRMNSNTRYLHPAQVVFAQKITSKLPESLSVCFFVNSGSEANELALRLARAATGGHDMITPDHGYHGNTTGAIDLSAYKFNAKGGVGPSEWVHLIEVADDYRGRHRRDDAGRAEKYAAQIDDALARISARNGKLAGFIAETFPSVGGQIIPPAGYLAKVYERIRAAGGICIADEVQTGLGRLGDYYFGFEQQQALPDVVVLGKPIGNGHPLGVVVTTPKIAEAFAQGPEYFSTFGGSTLSCRIGKEVLDIVDDEGLMENARLMGTSLREGLLQLAQKHSLVGDVRGFGLFIGVDLVQDRESRLPATQVADYVKNRMRDLRILIGCEGPADNILKIRPPLTVDEEGVEMILAGLDQTLQEAACLLSMGSPDQCSGANGAR